MSPSAPLGTAREPDDFILDEPAARTHTPPGWPIEVLEFSPSGKAPKAYGPNTYRFGAAMTLSVILLRRGWTLIKETKNYAYLTPPDQQVPPFRISIAVPTEAECLAIAHRSYARGRSWLGQLGEWPAAYTHERNTDMRRLWRDRATGAMKSELHPSPPQSDLSIGEYGIWHAEVTGVGGDFVTGILPRALAEQVKAATADTALTEGATKTVELTVYERNPAARRLCIAHFGPTCQACGLTYEEKYGAIGADLIHVHHLTPLAEIGESYEVDPIRDLVPLCASCHHVVHRRNPPYTITEIKQAILEQQLRQAAAAEGGA